MAKRGRKKKFRLNFNVRQETLRSIAALALILLGVLSFISFFAPNYPVNAIIQRFLRGLFGVPSFLLPVLLVLFGITFVDSIKLKVREFRLVLGLFALLLTLCGLFHVFIPLDKAYKIAYNGGGGGLIGYKIVSILRKTVSIYGGVPFLFLALIMSLVLIFDISINEVIDFTEKFFPRLKLGFLRNKFLRSKGGLGGEMEIAVKTEAEEGQEDGGERIKEPVFEVVPTMSEPQGQKGAGIDVSSLARQKMTNPLGMDKIWKTPPLELLSDPIGEGADAGDVKVRAKIIKDKLKSFGIDVEVVDIQKGPSVTQYALETGSDVRIAKISNLQNDLALALASPNGTVRIEAPIPGRSQVGVEVPNNVRAIVNFKSLITSAPMKALKSKLGIVLGKDVSGLVQTCDLAKMPHLLVAGTTGSGKSVLLHNILFSILFRASPQEVKFILVDPKRVELVHYQGIPHLLTPVVTDMERAPSVFRWAVAEMQKRYKYFEQAKVQNIDTYNERSGILALPYIVIIVDELADIMIQDPAGVEKSIIRLAQLARATGIHLVLSLQRPTTDVITGMIKANIPARIAFNVATNMDSRVIIDQPGAEKLLGKGDMLFIPPDMPKPMRLQGAFVSMTEIKNLVEFLKGQGVEPEYKEEVLQVPLMGASGSAGRSSRGTDSYFDEAAEIIIRSRKASASLLQRKLSIGYARAARIIDELEHAGIIGPADGSKPRDVLVDDYPTPSRGKDTVDSLS